MRWRSVLFVPGDRPDRIARAGTRGAGAVVVDLEDAVVPEMKASARKAAVDLLQAGLGGPVLIRVNAVDSDDFARDLEVLAPVLDLIEAIVLPKAEGPADVRRLEAMCRQGGPLIIPTIETAGGVFEARAIATAPQVVSLLFGPADLCAQLGIDPTPGGEELTYARAQVVLACAAAGIAAPIDGPHLWLGDDDGLAESTRAARTLGFGGKAVIHPEQIPVVHAGFAPAAAEIAWARNVLAAAESASAEERGAARLDDGTFVDEPVVARARALLRDLPLGEMQ